MDTTRVPEASRSSGGAEDCPQPALKGWERSRLEAMEWMELREEPRDLIDS
jgi:hypothetical protein